MLRWSGSYILRERMIILVVGNKLGNRGFVVMSNGRTPPSQSTVEYRHPTSVPMHSGIV